MPPPCVSPGSCPTSNRKRPTRPPFSQDRNAMMNTKVRIKPNRTPVITETLRPTRRVLTTACCVAVAMLFARGATAQQLPLEPAPSSAIGNESVDEVRRKLDQLIETTEQARRLRGGETFSTRTPTQTPTGDAESRSWTAPAESSQQASSDDPDTARQINEIRERLRILQRFRREQAISQRT